MTRSILAVIATLLADATVAAASPPPIADAGLRLNLRGTVAVRMQTEAGRLSGAIVWAAGPALADARESGVARLVGTRLIDAGRAIAPGIWSATIYVPDLGHHFPSTITALDDRALKVTGCLLGGFFCRSQLWQRIDRVPGA